MRKKCIICPANIYNAQKRKNNFLCFPLALIALVIRNIKSGVAENAYSSNKMFILLFYSMFSIWAKRKARKSG